MPVISGTDETKLEKSKQMSKIFMPEEAEIIIGTTDVISLSNNGLRISTGAMALSHEDLGDWVSIDLMEYHAEESETREYCSMNVSREHARDFALLILRELDRSK